MGSGIQEWNPESREWNPESREWDPESRKWNPESREWNPESREWNPRIQGMESGIQGVESRIQEWNRNQAWNPESGSGMNLNRNLCIMSLYEFMSICVRSR